ncbi:MAG: lipid A export permease/ATP-binding protein MsbA [Pseudomonadales bacterium]|nr:lipid A export permease/ATP-binding protein MsbA [Pseudomonadales bacterium]
MPTNPEENKLQTYFRLLAYLKPLKFHFAISIFGFMVFAASQPALAKFMEMVIYSIEHKEADARFWLPAIAIGIFIVRGIGSFLGNYYNEYVGASVVTTVKLEIFNHLTELPAEFYDKTTQGQVLHRLSSGAGQIKKTVTGALKTLIREGLTIIFLLAYVFYLNWQLSLIFLLIAPVLAALVSYTSRKFRKISRKNEGILGEVMQVSKEMVSNYGVVRSFGAQDYEKQRYSSALMRAFRAQLKIRRVAATFTPVTQLIVASAVAFIVFMLLTPTTLATYSASELIGYLTAIALIPKPLRQLSGVNVAIQKGLIGAELIFTILDTEPEKDEGTHEVDTVEGHIEVKDFSFRYPSGKDDVIKNISLSVKAGEMVALVGKSGSGKSTLASLLTRAYQIEDGKVFLDGTDINQYKLTNLRKHVSVVNQNVSLFNDTIRNNIAYGDSNYSDEEVIAAMHHSHSYEFIQDQPKGLKSTIGEDGLQLSGGQRQRLSIARAFLKNSPVLILDEATSALDNESERIIKKATEELAETRTTIVIAHRLSTIEQADRLIVMDDGKIVEMGTHKELLEQKGYYSRLFHSEYE